MCPWTGACSPAACCGHCSLCLSPCLPSLSLAGDKQKLKNGKERRVAVKNERRERMGKGEGVEEASGCFLGCWVVFSSSNSPFFGQHLYVLPAKAVPLMPGGKARLSIVGWVELLAGIVRIARALRQPGSLQTTRLEEVEIWQLIPAPLRFLCKTLCSQ